MYRLRSRRSTGSTSRLLTAPPAPIYCNTPSACVGGSIRSRLGSRHESARCTPPQGRRRLLICIPVAAALSSAERRAQATPVGDDRRCAVIRRRPGDGDRSAPSTSMRSPTPPPASTTTSRRRCSTWKADLLSDATSMSPEQFGRSCRQLARRLERDQGVERNRRQRRETSLSRKLDMAAAAWSRAGSPSIPTRQGPPDPQRQPAPTPSTASALPLLRLRWLRRGVRSMRDPPHPPLGLWWADRSREPDPTLPPTISHHLELRIDAVRSTGAASDRLGVEVHGRAASTVSAAVLQIHRRCAGRTPRQPASKRPIKQAGQAPIRPDALGLRFRERVLNELGEAEPIEQE